MARVPIVWSVCAVPLVAGCSFLAPPDDELLGGTRPSSASSASSGGSAGGAVSGFCAGQGELDPAVRFCEDFDEGDGGLDVGTWTSIPDDPSSTTAELVTDPVASSPRAARLTVLPGAPDCSSAHLTRRLAGTAGDGNAAPRRLHFGASIGVANDGFFGRIGLATCVAILAVHGSGDTVGLEFQWDDGGFKSAYVNYLADSNIRGRMPHVGFALDLDAASIDFSIDGKKATPDDPLQLPAPCRAADVATEFAVGPTCDRMSAVYDDVTFGTD